MQCALCVCVCLCLTERTRVLRCLATVDFRSPAVRASRFPLLFQFDIFTAIVRTSTRQPFNLPIATDHRHIFVFANCNIVAETRNNNAPNKMKQKKNKLKKKNAFGKWIAVIHLQRKYKHNHDECAPRRSHAFANMWSTVQ